MALKMLAGSKTITTIQEGSIYKERWTTGSSESWPAGSTARQEFLDSSGGVIAEIVAESVDARHINFANAYADVADVPNGAGFRCYLTDPDEELGEQQVKYGTVFRRENFFPTSPSQLRNYEPKRFTDDFQRPAGPLGGKWVTLRGRPRIFTNGSQPNSVGPDYAYYSQYLTRYYVPFLGDSVDLSLSLYDKGDGSTSVLLNCNSDASAYIFVRFDAYHNNVVLGIGHGKDVSPDGGQTTPKVDPVSISIPGLSGGGQPGNFKLRYDEATKALGFYNSDYTTKYVEWIDEDDEAPHGKGYRYFGIFGEAALTNSGVQVAYISAANIV